MVGTHALLYEGVDFADLGLVVVDEQHRFGVEQRDALRAKAEQPPHVLVMTATPIPRTVAMTVYGDLEISTLAQLPRGPLADRLARGAGGGEAGLPGPGLAAAARGGRGRAPGVRGLPADRRRPAAADEEPPPDDDESARRPPLAVTEVAPLLAEGPLHGLRIGVLHGRLPADEKDAVMRAFAAGELDVLVATTVIEVGVDVPNATVMIVLDADRFGVSQLHQLRGRVGRGSAAGPLPAGHRGAGGLAGPGAAGRGRLHHRRFPAGRARPGAAPRGRRARRDPVRPPLAPAAALAAARRRS